MEYIDSVCNFSKNMLNNFKNLQDKSMKSFVEILANDVAVSGEKIDNLLFFLLVMSKGVSTGEFKGLLERLCLSSVQVEKYLFIRSQLIGVQPKVEAWFEKKRPMSSLHLLLKNVAMEAILYMVVRLEKEHGEELKRQLSYYIYQVRHEKIDITGNDILRLGVEQGAKVGEILQKVLLAKIDGIIAGYDEEIVYAEGLINKIII